MRKCVNCSKELGEEMLLSPFGHVCYPCLAEFLDATEEDDIELEAWIERGKDERNAESRSITG